MTKPSLVKIALALALCWPATKCLVSAERSDPQGGETVDINGMTMYYETLGEGEPLLLLHGFSSSGQESWQLFSEQLSQTYKLIIPDLRGHGRSTNPASTFTHRQCALDVYALLDHLKIRRVRAAGISTGGMTLLHMATQHPDRIRTMILIGATHRFTDQNRVIQGQATVESLSEEGDIWGGYEQMRRIHIRGDEQIRQLRQQFRAFKDNFDDMNFTKEHLGQIRTSTLIIHGDRDEFFPVEIPVEMYKAIPNSSLWIVPKSGHVPIIASRFPLVRAENVPFVATAIDFFKSQEHVAE